MIRETKPRKAKHAFEIKMSEDMLEHVPAMADMVIVLGSVKKGESTYWTEYKNSAGTYTLTVYVNDADLAARIREAIVPRHDPKPIEIGDKVIVRNPGSTYDTYHTWPDRKQNVPNFEYGNTPPAGYTGTVTHIGEHEENYGGTLYVIDGRFIVGADAFKTKEQ